MRADKLREVKDGHDGTWVAHPGLVPIAREVFDAHMKGPNQLDMLREDVNATAADLLPVPDRPRTEEGLCAQRPRRRAVPRGVAPASNTYAARRLLHVSFIKPHHPFDPPPPWDEMYDPNVLTVLPGWTDQVPTEDLPHQPGYFANEDLTEPVLRQVMAYYYATISQLDHQVGRLLDLLHERGAYDDALILFTADHGEYLGFHHQLLKGGRHLYDPLTRVPLLVKLPGRARAGEINDALTSQIDIAPTILAAAEVKHTLSGLDLADPVANRGYVFAEAENGTACMARTRTHKLLVSRGSDALFDLTSDPYELTNRITDADLSGTAAELRTAITEWALSDAIPAPYLDQHAPLCVRANAITPNGTRQADVRAYFEERVQDRMR